MTDDRNSGQKRVDDKKPEEFQFNPGNMAGKIGDTCKPSEKKPEKSEFNPGNMAGKTGDTKDAPEKPNGGGMRDS